LTACTEQSG